MICVDGIGPISSIRILDFTLCFEEIVLLSAGKVLLFLAIILIFTSNLSSCTKLVAISSNAESSSSSCSSPSRHDGPYRSVPDHDHGHGHDLDSSESIVITNRSNKIMVHYFKLFVVFLLGMTSLARTIFEFYNVNAGKGDGLTAPFIAGRDRIETPKMLDYGFNRTTLNTSGSSKDLETISLVISLFSASFYFSLIAFIHYLSFYTKKVKPSCSLLLFYLYEIIVNMLIMRTILTSPDVPSFNTIHIKTWHVVDNILIISALLKLTLLVLCFLLESFSPILDDSFYQIKKNMTPEYTANIFSKISFFWMTSLMKTGYAKVLTMDDLWDLKPEDSSEHVSEQFQTQLQFELEKKNPSLLWACFSTFWKTIITTFFFKFIQDILQFTQPQLLNLLMAFVASYAPDSPVQEMPFRVGFAIAFLMFFTAITQTIFLHQYFQACFMMGMQVRSGIITAIYQKSLRLSNGARQGSTVGEITNLMSVDTSKLADMCGYFHILWSGPLQIGIAIYFLYQTLGVSVFGGIAVMLVMVPVNAVIATKSRNLNKIQMANKDNRTKMVDEVLAGMKVIKLYAWERPFIQRISEVREQELATLKSIAYLQSASSFTWSVTPFLVAFITFATYSFISPEPLTSTKVFVSLSLFNLLGFPLAVFPSMITAAVEASVSFNRLLKFFMNEEQDSKAVIRPLFVDEVENNDKPVDRVVIENGSFNWDPDGTMILKNINYTLTSGKLQTVVGTVGIGKSSLISAILGDMYKHSGIVTVKGSVAYVAQSAWIINSTVKDNILFGRKFDAEFYEATIEACGLIEDFKSLVAGDETEIGERGINLSGGQKQRVSIARAVYSRADIYLFDDCLSAVDAHVGRHIFDNVMGPNGMLASKARILVTHGIQYLAASDYICLLAENTIKECGKYEDLMKMKKGVYALVRDYGKQPAKSNPEKEDKLKPVAKAETKMPKKLDSHTGSLMTKEEGATGKVDWKVYASYAESCGYYSVVVFIVLGIFNQCLSVSQNVLLSKWADYNDRHDNSLFIFKETRSLAFWLTSYGALGITSSFFLVFQVLYAWVFCGIRSARVLHSSLLENVLRLPQSFFDTIPLGRVLNRFSKDQYTVDEVLPRSFLGYFRTLFIVISVLGVNALGNPYYIIFALPLGFVYVYFQHFYIATSRELKRLDSTSRSPIYSTFQETLYGVSTIRAYGQDARFIQNMNDRVDFNQKAYYPSVSSNRWLAVRLEFIGALIVFGSAALGVLSLMHDRSTSSALIGLMLVYSLSVTQTLNWMVRQSCEIETNIVSIERIKEYIELKQEAPSEISTTYPGDSWPQTGEIIFEDYSTRYRSELPLVVKELSFKIRPKEKIGIVGRTGAGKSSITMALFRIIEAAGGKIFIDGVDIATIGLFNLRKKISIIPQDPVLFNGSVRENLDPFHTVDEQTLWSALERVGLKPYIQSLSGKLGFIILQNGENFSQGQRQLICLARALIRDSKILVLDEATAAIDVETDSVIQKTIRRDLADCTIVTIAHRIGTLMDYDRILVLDKGRMVEYDTPKALLGNKKGMFYGLAKESGLHEYSF